MKQYVVVPYLTGCISGTISESKLQDMLNAHANQGWKLARTIHETRKVLLVFQREAHFLIFERDV